MVNLSRTNARLSNVGAAVRSTVGVETTAQLVWILAPRLPEPEGP